jgi:MFS family permease
MLVAAWRVSRSRRPVIRRSGSGGNPAPNRCDWADREAGDVYQAENIRAVLAGRGRGARGLWPRVNRTVLLLGVTSLFTDISSEMVATILPLYLVYTLGFTPLQFGFIDGLYQGASALVRIASGLVGDRWRRHKEVAVLGYGLSAVCKPAFLLVGSAWAGLVGIILLDRTGKGIRTAPRDALISLSTPREQLATAFGVHRALDTVGAMLGPLLAFSLLTLRPGHFKPIFVISFCFAVVGVSILMLFVENRRPERSAASESVSLRSAGRLLAEPGFRILVIVGAALGLTTMSDGFLYLSLQRQVDFDPSYLPLLFVGTAAIFMFLAVPAGRIADRIGRARVFLCGFVPLLLAYGLLLVSSFGLLELGIFLILLGAYYAATDGVLMALASTTVPEHLRGSGLALLVTATSLAKLVASIAFGALWAAFDARTAVIAFAVALAVTLCLAATALAVNQRRPLSA